MKAYEIKIVRKEHEHIIPALRSCIESARLAHELASVVSAHYPDDTVYVTLFADCKAVYAADYELGTLCGIISPHCTEQLKRIWNY